MKKFLEGFIHAFDGILSAVKSERNLKVHLGFMLAVIVAGLIFRISLLEWLFCFVCFMMVISAELFNTAIEATVDLCTEERKPLAKKAKDVAAGAVLVTAFFSAIIGLIIFVPKLFR